MSGGEGLMTEEVDFFEIIGQLKKKLRTDLEKEAFVIVFKNFINYFVLDEKIESSVFIDFLVNFKKLKKEVKCSPERVEIKASNERDLKFRHIVVDLMLEDKKIINLGKQLNKKRIIVPTEYEEAKTDFIRYQHVIYKVGRKTILSCLERINETAKDNDIEIPSWFCDVLVKDDYFGFKPDLSGIYDSIDSLIGFFDYDDDERARYEHALKSLEFIEREILGVDGLYTLYKRWQEAPLIFIPKHVAAKNPQTLLTLYDEAVRTYSAGNFLACITMCRSLYEHILINYYGAKTEDDLTNIISWSEKKYESLKDLYLHEKRKKANNIIHNYNGEHIREKTVLDYIRTVKSLIERIPDKKRI